LKSYNIILHQYYLKNNTDKRLKYISNVHILILCNNTHITNNDLKYLVIFIPKELKFIIFYKSLMIKLFIILVIIDLLYLKIIGYPLFSKVIKKITNKDINFNYIGLLSYFLLFYNKK